MNSPLELMLQQAVQAFQSGNFNTAEVTLSRILLAHPKNLPALHILGLIKASQSKHKEAAELLKRAVRLNPNDPSLQYNLAKALQDAGADKDSLPHHKKAIGLSPNNHEAWLNYGKSLARLKFDDEALAAFTKALRLRPDYAEALLNIGATLKELKRYDEALSYADQALGFNPNLTEALSNKGVAYKALKRYDEALASYEKAISLNPDSPDAWTNRGVSYQELKRYDEALASYEKAISLNPDSPDAWTNRGVSYQELKRYDEALASYEKAISLNPDFDYLLGNYIHTKLLVGNWSRLDSETRLLAEKVHSSKKITSPFALLSIIDSPALHFEASKIWANDKAPPNFLLPPIPKTVNNKIRIGYFSADFGNHPVSFLTAELFELHDTSQFELYAFSLRKNEEVDIQLRIKKSFNQFFDVHNKSDKEVAQIARDAGIDIAIDLGGLTSHNRPGIFSFRAAPIQMSYIGYLGTMGAKYFDYLIADTTLIPPNSQQYYSEKIIYLPSYQVNDSKRKIPAKDVTREELGLPKEGFVFCCFNNNYKILPTTFDSWMRILKAVDASTLFLYADNEWSEANLKKEAEKRGINSQRLVFGKRVSLDDYLARYRVCDLFLDTSPYNAGTTASDALWTGLPVITLSGQAFPARVASSLLNAIALPELITQTPAEYESLAIRLATNPNELNQLKKKLADHRLTTLLFNTPLFTKHLEIAFTKVYARYQAGIEPDHLYIENSN